MVTAALERPAAHGASSQQLDWHWHWHWPYVRVLGPVRLAAGFFSSQNVFVNTMMQRDFTYMVQRQRRINMPQALRDLCTVWYEL